MNEYPRPGRPLTLDEDAIAAAGDVIRRSGARGFELGYTNDEATRVEDAAWFAWADYGGTRIIVENRASPEEAAEALARRLLTGAKCKHCSGLVALSDDGAVAYPGLMRDGSTMTVEQARTMRQCRWTREGPKWVPGCTKDRHPGRSSKAARAKLKAKRRQGRR